MMLSRVADNLYWMSRYLERAEHTARLVDVTLDLMPDRSPEANQQAWQRVLGSLPISEPVTPPLDAYQLTQTLTLNASSQTSILAYISKARENTRQVREQVSSEMWEQINRLYLELKGANLKKIWRDQPHDFFQKIKQGTHLFQGICDSTMNHGEGWHFIQVGQYIERAGNVAALLTMHHQNTLNPEQEVKSSDQYLDWVGLLRYCTAFEAYCKIYTAETRFDRIAEFLLLNDEFPHSVHFSVNRVRAALNAIAEATDIRKNNQVNRRAGRLKAMLDYDQIDEVLSGDLPGYLSTIQQQCAQINAIIYQTYIDYPADEKLIL